MIRRQMASPSPVPLALVVKNGSNALCRTVSSMPWPWSTTAMVTRPPACEKTISIRPPRRDAWAALKIRFMTRCSMCPGVGPDRRHRLGTDHDDLDVLHRGRAADHLEGVFHRGGQVQRVQRGCRRPRVIEHVLHRRVQPGDLADDLADHVSSRVIQCQAVANDLNGAADTGQGIADLVGEGRGHPAPI